MKTILARGKERTLLSGLAELTSKNNFISADSIELYGKDYNYIYCTGNVHVINKEKDIEVWSNKLFYNRKDNIIRFQENAVMEDKENEIVVKGGLIETWEDDEITIIQIGVRILKKDMVCRSEFARYLRNEDRLELSGMPRVIWKGDEYKALKILIDLKNDEIHLEGNVRGEVFWEEKDKEEEGGESVPEDEGGADVGEGGDTTPGLFDGDGDE
jgi:lipopolysaccharide export system protein LptA